MREDFEIRNYEKTRRTLRVELDVDADLAGLFEVKENRVVRRGEYAYEFEPGRLAFRRKWAGHVRTVEVLVSPDAEILGETIVWHVQVPPGDRWSTCLEVSLRVGDRSIEPGYRCGLPVSEAAPAKRFRTWQETAPRVKTSHAPLANAVQRAVADLGALRIFDPDRPDKAVIAAGAPWFMTLFGRDSLIASWMALIVEPDLALATLETLARFQGQRVDEATEEQPGRILHEIRFGEAASLSLGGAHVYYGSVDATLLFVMLLGELRRWGLADDLVPRLLPHADRALEWAEVWGDRDGDGYVEYMRSSPHGLRNQGWKDSWDGITFADGTLAEPPIALCEVQGYLYGAYVARAHFAQEAGDEEEARRWQSKAHDLRYRFNRDFWLEDRQCFALGLDKDKRPIDSVASNMGHCLWTGIVEPDKAAMVAKRLLAEDMFSGWGVRTLSTEMGAYNPVSYHCGSVWPHDNALVAAGLLRYGFVEEAHRIIRGQLEAADALGGRLPELFSGLERGDLEVPVSYPTSCSPQAWAAAAPLYYLRLLLRLDPWIPHGKVWLAPELPEWIPDLRIEGIRLGADHVDIEVADGRVHVDGLSGRVELIRHPRQPLTAVIPP